MRLTDGAPADSEIDASTGVKTNAAHRAKNTMTPVNGTKSDREARRWRLGINRSFQKITKEFPHFIREGIPERRALGMKGAFTSILASGQGKLPVILHRMGIVNLTQEETRIGNPTR